MMDEIINKIDEDAQLIQLHGGVDMSKCKTSLTKSHNKYKKDNEKETEDLLRRTIMKNLVLK